MRIQKRSSWLQKSTNKLYLCNVLFASKYLAFLLFSKKKMSEFPFPRQSSLTKSASRYGIQIYPLLQPPCRWLRGWVRQQEALDIHSPRCYLTVAILLHLLGIIYILSGTISPTLIGSLTSQSACMTENYLDRIWAKRCSGIKLAYFC